MDIAATGPGPGVGRWGWDGGTGTTVRVDPSRGTVAVLLTQRAMAGPGDGFGDFHAAVAEAASRLLRLGRLPARRGGEP
ncbi:beta-lactamase family protein [Rhizomonospora bruguierae]|uniref:beta-lactamase family protein n=1 Tax=Rhizomonospora bruguierae TaxID=1581705 RepID=UPI0020C0D66B|nr:beta-lactamase family protein [Micromonospora sp. NBRC 107566]